MPEHGLPVPVKADVEDPKGEVQQKPHYYPEFYNSVPYLVVFDFLIRPLAYLRASKLSFVRYVVAGCAFYGGLFFLVGAFAGSSGPLNDAYALKGFKGFHAVYPWLVSVGYFIGTYIFTVGCFTLTVESLNLQYDEEMTEWKTGKRAEKPKFHLFGFPLRNLGWWAGVSYTTGALMYNVGSTSFLANTFRSVNFSADMVQYLGYLPYLTGGPFFLTSGFLYLVQFSKNPLRGMFIPLCKSDLCSVTWWVNWLNWWGGCGFCMSGIWEYFWADIPVQMYRIQNDIGFGIGGLFFSAGGFLLYAQGSVAKCKVQSSTTTHDVLGHSDYNNAPAGPSQVL